jgi:hypothetical protein
MFPTRFEFKIATNTVCEKLNINNFDIVVSGIGKKTLKTLKENLNYKNYFLLGFAGNLKDEDLYAKSLLVTKVTNKIDEIILKKDINLGLESATLITVKRPVVNTKIKKELSLTADIVDMEGYYTAKFSQENDLNLSIIKTISDNCDKNIIKIFTQGQEDKVFAAANELKRIFNKILNL